MKVLIANVLMDLSLCYKIQEAHDENVSALAFHFIGLDKNIVFAFACFTDTQKQEYESFKKDVYELYAQSDINKIPKIKAPINRIA
jgi:hypothetical protein